MSERELKEKIVKHLKLREGVVYKVYLDSLGYKTGGVGHLLRDAPNWNVGDKISESQVDLWLEEDMEWALDAAKKQLDEIKIKNPHANTDDFLIALTIVNFQLGIGWPNVFKTSYPKLVNGDYDGAIKGFKSSKWARQTPIRVDDFVTAIQKAYTDLSKTKEIITYADHNSRNSTPRFNFWRWIFGSKWTGK